MAPDEILVLLKSLLARLLGALLRLLLHLLLKLLLPAVPLPCRAHLITAALRFPLIQQGIGSRGPNGDARRAGAAVRDPLVNLIHG
jgi:hypothetical protein